uniref:Uncharacterized protein n=1 Tax=Cucumis sativus TaxID=3659 RepID=A0A0A0LJD4_CUCSA
MLNDPLLTKIHSRAWGRSNLLCLRLAQSLLVLHVGVTLLSVSLAWCHSRPSSVGLTLPPPIFKSLSKKFLAHACCAGVEEEVGESSCVKTKEEEARENDEDWLDKREKKS